MFALLDKGRPFGCLKPKNSINMPNSTQSDKRDYLHRLFFFLCSKETVFLDSLC